MITKKKKTKELGLKSYCNKDVDSFTLLLEVRKEKHEGSHKRILILKLRQQVSQRHRRNVNPSVKHFD